MTIPLSVLPEGGSYHTPPDEEAGFGALATPRGRLPLQALDVRARIDGLLAEVGLAQTFVNAFDEPLEATYVFPLPDRSAVTRFRMEVGGRVVEGVLKERGAARREYDVALKAGHRAGIAEEERPGVFTLRVGNLMPGEAATVRLSLCGPVVYDAGEVTFRFPLVVAPRYVPGVPLSGPSVGSGTAVDTDAVPDASRISPPVLLPGFPSPVRLSLAVDVFPAGLPVSDLCCTLHAAVAERRDGGFRVTLQPGERLNRDFVLRYRLGEEAVRTALLLAPDHEDRREGTFALTVVPPARLAQTSGPRDVVFVLDRSGSMAGWKMVAARRALARMVDTLTERDRFTVYAFDDRLETPPWLSGLVPATDRNRFRAIEYLAKVEARGGTEMARPLDLAVQQLTGERDRVLVLITDGQVGNEDQILHALGQRLAGIRVFTLGIDQAVNEAFLRRLAALGGGCCDVVESEDRLDEVMEKVQRRVGTPLMTGLRLEAAGLRLDPASLTPPRLPDLFAGGAVTILGRYRGEPEGSITLQGRDEAGRPWSQRVVGRFSDSAALAPSWARSQVRVLEDRFVIGDGDPAALEKQILALSLRFGVLCRFTAYVAVDRAEVVNEGGRRHEVTQPVEMPAGWEMVPGTVAGVREAMEAVRDQLAEPLETLEDLRAAAPPRCAPPQPGVVPKETVLARQVLLDKMRDKNDSARVSKKTHSAPNEAAEACKRRLPDSAADGGESIERPRSLRRREPRRSGSLLGKLGDLFRGKEVGAPRQGPAQTPAGPNLDAYRRRATGILKVLNQALATPGGDRFGILATVAVTLAALIEDLKSVGAAADVLQPLEKLHADLRQLASSDRLPEAEIDRLWSECVKVLAAFSGVTAAATSR